MNCSCCGKKKGLLESFEALDTDVNICVECSKSLYKYQDYIREKNKEDASKILEIISNKKNTTQFKQWLDGFIKRIQPIEDVTTKEV